MKESESRASPARTRHTPALRIGLLAGVLVVASFVIVWRMNSPDVASAAVPRVGGPAPEFALQNTNGSSVELLSQRGRPVILNFWATWCPPCKAEIPAIGDVARAHPEVSVLAVDVLEGPDLVHDFVKTMNLGFVPLLDPTGKVAGNYHVSSLPSSFFIDGDGTIRAINVGPMDQQTIEQDLSRTQS